MYTGETLVKSVEQFAPGDELMVRLKDGSATARVEQINREEKHNGSQENRPRE